MSFPERLILEKYWVESEIFLLGKEEIKRNYFCRETQIRIHFCLVRNVNALFLVRYVKTKYDKFSLLIEGIHKSAKWRWKRSNKKYWWLELGFISYLFHIIIISDTIKVIYCYFLRTSSKKWFLVWKFKQEGPVNSLKVYVLGEQDWYIINARIVQV